MFEQRIETPCRLHSKCRWSTNATTSKVSNDIRSNKIERRVSFSARSQTRSHLDRSVTDTAPMSFYDPQPLRNDPAPVISKFAGSMNSSSGLSLIFQVRHLWLILTNHVPRLNNQRPRRTPRITTNI